LPNDERHQAIGRYAEAEPLCQRALAILEKTLPPDHPSPIEEIHAMSCNTPQLLS